MRIVTNDSKFIAPDQVEKPPQAPRLGVPPRLYLFQWIGVPVLLLIVVLAVFDVFGETRKTVSGGGDGALAVEAVYPGRFRYKLIDRFWIRVENRSDRTLDTVRVAFEPDYLRSFSNVTATPAFEEVYTVPLVDVGPGEARIVEVGVQAERAGMHRGWLAASSDAGAVRLELATFVFP